MSKATLVPSGFCASGAGGSSNLPIRLIDNLAHAFIRAIHTPCGFNVGSQGQRSTGQLGSRMHVQHLASQILRFRSFLGNPRGSNRLTGTHILGQYSGNYRGAISNEIAVAVSLAEMQQNHPNRRFHNWDDCSRKSSRCRLHTSTGNKLVDFLVELPKSAGYAWAEVKGTHQQRRVSGPAARQRTLDEAVTQLISMPQTITTMNGRSHRCSLWLMAVCRIAVGNGLQLDAVEVI